MPRSRFEDFCSCRFAARVICSVLARHLTAIDFSALLHNLPHSSYFIYLLTLINVEIPNVSLAATEIATEKSI